MIMPSILWFLYNLRKSQYYKLGDLEKLQNKKLASLIKHAYDNSQFYHRRFREAGLRPEDIKDKEDLKKIPITTRIDVQDNLYQFVSKELNPENCQRYTSSGSTGIPVTVFVHGNSEAYRAALFARPFLENGLRLYDKMLRITAVHSANVHWYEKFGIMRKMCVSPVEPLDSVIPLFEKYRPDAIFGNSSYLLLLAEKKNEINPTFSPRLIFSTAELLSLRSRKEIESAFNQKVFDLYGSVETERLAWECSEHTGYHMDVDSHVMEFVDNPNENVSYGERGEILVTPLYNYSMPLIRYEIGDIGVPVDDECPCQRGLPLMERIEGRISNFILLPDGRLIPPTAFLDLDDVSGIRKFQVVQLKENLINVRLVTNNSFTNEIHSQITEVLKKIVGNEVDIVIDYFEDIPRESSGKYMTVKSMLRSARMV
ncbi:coenzyme F390 synthetase [Thaumarchaeota archaeon SCGC AB-539-E09]|nr:coenzyme F390 synthetase [Thaumarchaeota archaeon SCGC AB-539-E09]